MPTDMTGVIALQTTENQILTQMLAQFKAGIAVLATPAVYTVAALPATGASGQFAFASNGRKGAEGAGAGTGVPVYWNSATSQWFTYYNNTQVAA